MIIFLIIIIIVIIINSIVCPKNFSLIPKVEDKAFEIYSIHLRCF